MDGLKSPDRAGVQLTDADDASSEQRSSATRGQPAVTKGFGSPQPASFTSDSATKQLDFEVLPGGPTAAAVLPAVPSTPGTPVLATPLPKSGLLGEYGAESASPLDYNAFVKDTLLWQLKVRSVLYLLGGLLLIYSVDRLFSSSVSLITGVCWLLLGQLALNFVRGFVSPSLQAQCTWYDSAWTHGLIRQFSKTLLWLAALHDTHLRPAEPKTLLVVGSIAWLLSLAGRWMSASGVALLLWLAAFTLPKAYVTYQAQIDRAVGEAYTRASEQFQQLDSRVRAGVTLVPVMLLGYCLSPVDLAIAFLLLLIHCRTWLTSADVANIHRKVAPITATAAKVGAQMTDLVGKAAVKYDLTPTPAKSKAKRA